MLSASVSIFLLAASALGVPILSPGQVPAKSLSLLDKRQMVTYTEYVCEDADNPDSCTVSRTWTEGGDDGGSAPESVPERQATRPKPTESGFQGGMSDGADESSDTEESNNTEQSNNTEEPNNTQESNSTSEPNTTGQSPQSDVDSMLATINKWRAAYNVGALSWSQAMVDGAAQSGRLSNGNGDGFQHQGAENAAEVMTPGNDNDGGEDLKGYSPFEISYIAWLCEVPSDILGDACAVQNSVIAMEYGGQTGHHDILVDNSYTKIGCAFTKDPNAGEGFVQGLWICDLQ